jgi:tetratricopeptide (TPR) repeat protein
MLANPAELEQLLQQMPAERVGKGTHVVAGKRPETQLAPPGEQPAAEAPATGSSGEFEIEPPAGVVQEKSGVSSGEFELGEAPPKSDTGSDELIELQIPEEIKGSSGDLLEEVSLEGSSGNLLESVRHIREVGSSGDLLEGVHDASLEGSSGSLTEEKPAPAADRPPDEGDPFDVSHLIGDDTSSMVNLAEDLPGGEVRSSEREGSAAGISEPTSADVAASFLEEETRHPQASGESSAVDLISNPAAEVATRRRRGEAGRVPPEAEGMAWEEPEAVVVEEDRPIARREAPAAAAKPRYASRWIGGGLIGVGVGVAACVALWFAGIEPPASWRGASSTANPPLTPSNPPGVPTNPVVPPPAAPMARDDFRALQERGDFVKLREEQIPDGKDAEHADRLAARGEAEWLLFVQNWRKTKANQPIDGNDEVVQKALNDLNRAKTPQAQFWLGQIKEGTGDLAGARQVYTESLAQFKDNPQAQRLFQTALDRLDVLGEAPVTAPPAEKTGALQRPGRGENEPIALLLVALQGREGAAGAAADTEAGSHFWRAAKLAKEQNYDQALAELKQARDAHDRRRFERLRKSQNPTSDPNEEIFLRACDELRAYWQIRQSLSKGGYLDLAKQPDPVKAIDKLVADAKAPKSSDGGMQLVIDRLKKDKDVASAEPDLKDAGKGIDLLLEAKKKKEAQLQAVQASLQDAKYISDQQTDVAKGLQQLLKEKKEAGDTVAATTKVLESAKYVGPDQPSIAKGLEKLVADKVAAEDAAKTAAPQLKSANETLAAVAAKLAGAKLVATDARGADLVKGVEKALQTSDGSMTASLVGILGDFTRAGADAGARLASVADRAIRTIRESLANVSSVTAPETSIPAMPVRFEDLTVPNPLRAERQYAKGLNHYWAGRYSAAERALAEAVRLAGPSGRDARYFYFLGLARLAQGRGGEAITDFRQAGELERLNRPGRATVALTLERVQGEPRRFLERYGREQQAR